MQKMPNDPPSRAVTFELLADAEPGMMPRLLAPFARRDLCPDLVRARRTGETMRVEIGVAALPAEALPLIEGNLRQVIGVRRLAVLLQAGGRQAA